jgi:hypothetical protein
MEPIMTHNSFDAFTTDSGIYIEEKKKGSVKMVLIFLGFSLLMIILGFILGFFGGAGGRIVAFFFIWGGGLVFVVALIAFFLKLAINADPKITFDTNSNTLTLRGKVIPFADIEQIGPQMQIIMGRTMVMAMMIIKGKKKSLFSTGIVVTDTRDIEDLIAALDQLVQDSKSKKDVEA